MFIICKDNFDKEKTADLICRNEAVYTIKESGLYIYILLVALQRDSENNMYQCSRSSGKY